MAEKKVQGVPTPEETIAILTTQVLSLTSRMDALEQGSNGKGRRKREAKAVLDTKTGKVYHSHAAAGMAVAPEFGLKVHNFVWYEVIPKAPNRFKDISQEEYTKAVQEQQKAPAGANKAKG